jgi:hypothetical protein
MLNEDSIDEAKNTSPDEQTLEFPKSAEEDSPVIQIQSSFLNRHFSRLLTMA